MRFRRTLIPLTLLVLAAACGDAPRQPAATETSAGRAAPNVAGAGIDSLNARLSAAYRTRDPVAYGALYTDSAVFEWPAFNSVRGRAGMEGMARENWKALADMDLKLTVASRRFAADHATEIGAFEQSYTDAKGKRMIEYGRYVTVFAKQPGGGWLMDRFFGFADSSRAVTTPRA
jgi:ketosteroid isomerase-like protein